MGARLLAACACAAAFAALAVSGASAAGPTPSFSLSSTPGTGNFPIDVVTADFNNDGNLDAATADMYGGTVTVLLGNGAGSFTTRTTGPLPLLYVPSGTPLITGIATGDMNGDGNADIVVSTFEGEYVAVLLGNGDGTFQSPKTFNIKPGGQAFPGAVAIGDMNGDGKLDVVVTRELQSSVQILLGNGDGTLTAGPTFSSGGVWPTAVKLGDLNGDGNLDAVVANNQSSNVSVVYGDGAGGWSGSSTYSAPGLYGNNPSPELNTLTVADVDGNGYPDVLIPANHSSSGVITVLYGGAGGTLTPGSITIGSGREPWQVAVGDVNGDSIPDLVVTTWNSSLTTLAGLGGGAFSAPVGIYFGAPNFGLALGDFTGDGRLDAIGTSPFYNRADFARNTTVEPDTVPPVLASHDDVTAEATSAQGAVVSYTPPTATDDVDPHPTVACTPAAGSQFPLGDTTVTCTATDASHNSASETFVVHVVDTTPPALSLPGDLTTNQNSPQGAVVTFDASATDIVDGSVAVTCAPASGTVFAPGATVVSCSATDVHGNTAHGSFTVTVRSAADQLADLLARVSGLGPGKSLAQKVRNAQSKLAAGDAAGAASMLAAFENEVRAQTGKSLDAATAASLLGAAETIRAALGY